MDKSINKYKKNKNQILIIVVMKFKEYNNLILIIVVMKFKEYNNLCLSKWETIYYIYSYGYYF